MAVAASNGRRRNGWPATDLSGSRRQNSNRYGMRSHQRTRPVLRYPGAIQEKEDSKRGKGYWPDRIEQRPLPRRSEDEQGQAAAEIRPNIGAASSSATPPPPFQPLACQDRDEQR